MAVVPVGQGTSIPPMLPGGIVPVTADAVTKPDIPGGPAGPAGPGGPGGPLGPTLLHVTECSPEMQLTPVPTMRIAPLVFLTQERIVAASAAPPQVRAARGASTAKTTAPRHDRIGISSRGFVGSRRFSLPCS